MKKLILLILILTLLLTGCYGAYSTRSVYALDTIIDFHILGMSDGVFSSSVALINDYEKVFSRTDVDSELYELNSSESYTPSDKLYEIIEFSLSISDETGGAFDITAASLTDLWDITSDNPAVPSASDIQNALYTTGREKITANNGTLTKPQGLKLDLGAVAKGYIAEKTVTHLRANGALSGYVSFGGSIAVAGAKTNGDGWNIGIKDPRNEGGIVGSVVMTHGYMSTSGDYERYFEYNGVRYHHIFDTKTGYPADSGVISAVVISDSGALSDALSTACFVMGAEKTIQLYKSGKYDFEAILMLSDRTVVTTANSGFALTSEDWRQSELPYNK